MTELHLPALTLATVSLLRNPRGEKKLQAEVDHGDIWIKKNPKKNG